MTVVLGLIPARGGSKGIPGKNIAPLLGRPLLEYTCEAALQSRRLSRTLLSTDDERIAAAGRSCGVEVRFLRPAELAGDATPAVDVALHALDWLSEHEHWEPDILVLLQPTSPLRTARHIDEALEALEMSGADTVVSVVEVPHRFSPYALMVLKEGTLHDFHEGPLPFDRFRRQETPALYARNGPAVLAARVPVLRSRRSFYGETVIPYRMNGEDSVDIDTIRDLQEAERLLKARI